ncbi:sugar ABC transporter permease [Blautia schinkii]|nr:sugar ABC transporter permease [Blautia schinkii]
MDRKVKKKGVNRKIVLAGFLFMLPAFLIILVTIIIPLLWNIYLSFCEWKGGGTPSFVGLANYIQSFTTKGTRDAIAHSLFIGIISTLVSVFLGVGFALALYRIKGKLSGAARVIFYSPSMIPMTVLGLLFTFIFAASDKGLLNAVLAAMGLESLKHAWLSDRNTVLWVIAFIQGWRSSGTIMMLSYTAMLNIPSSLFESAELEGCGFIKKSRYIILPLIKQTVRLALSMTLVWAFKTYDLVWTMTQGGPANLSMTAPIMMIKTGFSYNQYGYAAAIGIICTVLIGLCIIFGRSVLKGENYEY